MKFLGLWLLIGGLWLSGCDSLDTFTGNNTSVEELRVEVISVRLHDTSAFTQGLLVHENLLYESTGLTGESTLREVNPQTGEVLRRVDLADEYFAEGLALVGDRLIQLTWQSGVAFVYDRATFNLIEQYTYQGQGWGLCYDGTSLYMSDGSSNLYVRDPQTFALTATIPVNLLGLPIDNLNELECVGDDIYANVWQQEHIIRIDKQTGRVNAVIDASGLLTPEERDGTDVFNGIAYDPQSGNFLVTGKLWHKMFEVRFVPVNSAEAA